jgi:hypothetical protein
MVENGKLVARIIWGECGEESLCGFHFRIPISLFADAIMALGDPSWQVVESLWVIALHTLALGDIVDCELPVGSHCVIVFCT